jgi:hypothetical protein
MGAARKRSYHDDKPDEDDVGEKVARLRELGGIELKTSGIGVRCTM